jgi:hypothetical protein
MGAESSKRIQSIVDEMQENIEDHTIRQHFAFAKPTDEEIQSYRATLKQERSQREAEYNERKAREDSRKSKIVEESSLEDFILEPKDYDVYLSEEYHETCDCGSIQIQGSEPYHSVDSIDKKRLVVRTAFMKKGEHLNPRLLTILQDIDYEAKYGANKIFKHMQMEIDNLKEENIAVQYDLVHYHTEGCGTDDWWQIIDTRCTKQ